MQQEIWKDVPRYTGYYQVSDHGRVRSLDRDVIYTTIDGTLASRHFTGCVLKQKTEYCKKTKRLKRMSVKLYMNGEMKDFTVHALVMEAFVGPRPTDLEIAHNDSNPTNNALGNLRYTTHIDNCNDRRAAGTEAIGERNPKAKLRNNDIPLIRSLIADRQTLDVIAAQFGVDRCCIHDIKQGRTWTHI